MSENPLQSLLGAASAAAIANISRTPEQRAADSAGVDLLSAQVLAALIEQRKELAAQHKLEREDAKANGTAVGSAEWKEMIDGQKRAIAAIDAMIARRGK